MFTTGIVESAMGLRRRLRAAWLSFRGVTLTGHCWLQNIEIPRNHFDIHLHRGVALDRGVTLLATGEQTQRPRIIIGRETYINRHTMIDSSECIDIGAHCMIGPFCYITDHDHGTALGKRIHEQPLIGSAVVIEDDCWIGAHVSILKGVRIGTGAVIGAGSVVTRDVAPKSIVAGIPAKEIGLRT